MIRHLMAPWTLITLCAFGLAGCADGLSTEEAEEECASIRAELSTSVLGDECWTPVSQAACMTCHEECGDACGTVDTVCEYTFSCPSE